MRIEILNSFKKRDRISNPVLYNHIDLFKKEYCEDFSYIFIFGDTFSIYFSESVNHIFKNMVKNNINND